MLNPFAAAYYSDKNRPNLAQLIVADLDTAELMFVDPASVRSPLEAGDGKNGVEGDPRGATAELGRALVQLKIDSAVEQIKRLAK